MLTAIEGVYRDGQVVLNEKPEGIDYASVVVTFLHSPSSGAQPARMRFGQLPAAGKFNDSDFSAAEWRGDNEAQ